MAERLGLEVEWIPGDWRHGADPERAEAVLRAGDGIRAVTVVHNETSTGVASRVPEIRAAIDAAGSDALLLVDTISSLGSIDYRHDEWGVDVTVGCSQKGLMLPPGLGFNAVSEKALAASERARLPRSYWDWQPILEANRAGFWPYTSATNLLYGLCEALALLREEQVDVGAVARLDGVATGVALIAVDARGENQIAVASGANAELEPALPPVHEGDVVLLSHEVPEAAVLAGARAARGPIVLNPAPARLLADELLALRPILTPNAGEARELTGRDEPEAAARALADRTGAPVLLTLGARGVLLVDGGEPELIAAPRVEVADTTGAGDTFNGALAAELAAGRALRDAAAFAVRAASLSTRVAGAREGMPRRAELT
jgi:hypothetical protein